MLSLYHNLINICLSYICENSQKVSDSNLIREEYSMVVREKLKSESEITSDG